ncbi:pectin esterase [Hymenobacter sedentarius]|uniref:Pectinesterase n=1 Tax=Hymenobacter sedentarius TaxID=1411621 RepID=A0A0U4AUC2_9BACT|nr:pectinesterase family protein [Hymenobacter sedentarius]ALW87056.1 pectin esterase [Hymenobacter sedentarius]
MLRIKLLAILLLAAFASRAQEVPKASPITVAQDGSGTYRTVQEAVNAVPDQSQKPVTIFIKKGTYREKLVVPTLKIRLTLVGESKDNTVITFDDHSGTNGINTYTSHSVLVQANDFSAENITFENTAGYTAGQAVALHVEGDRCAFKNCRVVGNQDILFLAADNRRQYFKDCYIEGTTDFIFGSSTAVFERCTIKSKKNSFITAASTPPEQEFGFVFLNCKLIADTALAKKVYLGRPWRPHAKVVYLNTEMGGHITPAGWENWKNPENEKTAYFVEYHSTGPGANPKARVAWSHQLTAKEAKRYTIKTIFAAKEPWNPAK